MKRNAIFLVTGLIAILLSLSALQAHSQTHYSCYPSTHLRFDESVGCQIVVNQKYYMDLMESQGDCFKFCEGTEVDFTVEGCTGSQYVFSVTGGAVQTITPNAHYRVTWNSVGQGQIVVTQTTPEGLSNTNTVCVEIIERPEAKFTVLPLEAGEIIYACVDQEVIFTNLSQYGGYDIISSVWNFGDGVTSAETNPAHVWTEAGEYIVSLTVTNECNCSDVFEIKVVIQEGKPVPIACPSVVCEGTMSVYSVPTGSCNAYKWNVKGGTWHPGQEPHQIEVVWDKPDDLIDGFGYIYLDNAPCPGACSKFTTAKVPVIMHNGKIKGDTYVCEGNQYMYSLPEWPATLFNWEVHTLSGSATATIAGIERDRTVALAFTGNGTVKLSATYSNTIMNCSGTAELIIQTRAATKIEREEEGPICLGSTDIARWKENSTVLSGNWRLVRPDGTVYTQNSNLFTYTYNQAGVYTLSVSGDACPPDDITIEVKSVSNATAVITGRDIVCVSSIYQYKAEGIHDDSFFEWEITGGTLFSATGDSVAATWTMEYDGTGLLSLYRVSREEPFCRKLINQMEVQRYNPNNIAIIENPNNNHYANCKQLFYVTYNGTEIYPYGGIYNWRISPNEAGSVLEYNFLGYDPTVLYNHTTVQRTTDTLFLHFSECTIGSKHIKILTINPVPIPMVTPASTFVCAGVPLTFQIGNSTLYDNMSYRIADGNEQSISGNNFTASFQNNTTINQHINVVVTGYKCGAPYHTTIAITVKPAPDLFITPNHLLKFCRDSSFNVSLTANAVIPISYIQWLCPDNSALMTDTCHATNFGTYHVTVTFNNGCTQEKDVFIDTKSCGGNSGGGCNVTLSKRIDCNQISFDLQSSRPLNYAWSSYPNGLVLVSGGSQAIFKATQAGYYTIEVRTSCWRSSHNIAIPVLPACSLSFACNSTQNGYIAHFYNTSSVLPGYTVAYEYLLDGNIVSSSVELPAGSIHTLIIRSYCDGIICDSDPLTFTVPAFLNAEFSTNFTPICVFVPITFTPLYSDDITDYLWNFDVINNQQGTSLLSTGEHAYQFGANEEHYDHLYKVSLTVTDKYGCNNIYTDSVTVVANKLYVFAYANPSTICAGSTATLTGRILTGSHNPATCQWNDLQTSTTASITVSTAQMYRFSVTDAMGCFASAITSIGVITIPDIAIRGTTAVCLGNEIRLSAQCGSDHQYVWNQLAPVALQGIGNEAILSYTPTEAGSYQFEVIVTTTNGAACSAADSVTVTVHDAPAALSIVSSIESCKPYIVKLSASPYYSAGSYHWSNGASGASVLVNHGGAYRVYYTDSHGCTVESPSLQVPHSPEYYLWTFPVGCYYFCSQETPVYVYGPAQFPLDAPYKWKWLHDGDTIASGAAPSYNEFGLEPPLKIIEKGVYQMELSAETCTVISGDMDVSIVSCKPCQLKIDYQNTYCWDGIMTSIDFSIDNPMGVRLNYTLQDISNTGITIHNPSGLLYPGGNTVHINITANSTPPIYVALELVVWDPYNPEYRCIYSMNFTIASCLYKGGFGGEGENDTPPALNQATPLDHFYLYPNPAEDNCIVAYRFAEEGSYQITLRDAAGKELRRTTLTESSGQLPIDLSSYSSGFYLIECRKESSLTRVLKVIKK